MTQDDIKAIVMKTLYEIAPELEDRSNNRFECKLPRPVRL